MLSRLHKTQEALAAKLKPQKGRKPQQQPVTRALIVLPYLSIGTCWGPAHINNSCSFYEDHWTQALRMGCKQADGTNPHNRGHAAQEQLLIVHLLPGLLAALSTWCAVLHIAMPCCCGAGLLIWSTVLCCAVHYVAAPAVSEKSQHLSKLLEPVRWRVKGYKGDDADGQPLSHPVRACNSCLL